MATGTSDFPEALTADAYDWYWESYDVLPKTFPEVFQVEKTNLLWRKSTSGVGTGLLIKKEEHEELEEKSPIEGYTVYSKVTGWGKIEYVSKELHDDVVKLGAFLKSQMPQWSKDVVETQETFYADVINKGGWTLGDVDTFGTYIPNVSPGYTTDGLLYDGSPLFAPTGTYHTSKGGGTYYNGLGALSISKANLQSAWNRFTITNNRKEDDTKMKIVPDILLASPALKFTVDELLKSPDDPGTTNRAINVLRDIVRPVYWHYLDDADQWTLAKAKFGLKALIRENPEFDMWENKKTKGYYMSIFVRFGVEIKDWRGLISANYATS